MQFRGDSVDSLLTRTVLSTKKMCIGIMVLMLEIRRLPVEYCETVLDLAYALFHLTIKIDKDMWPHQQLTCGFLTVYSDT